MKTSFAPMRYLCLLSLLVIAPPPTQAMDTSLVSPGVHRVERFTDEGLNEILDEANAPIFSPDGNHLYFGRLRNPELALLVTLSIDADGRPSLAGSRTNTDPGFENLSNVKIHAFNEDGTRAYASAQLDDQDALVVLERTPASGELSVFQILSFGENERAVSIELTQDKQVLYAAIPTITPRPDSNTTAGRIIRFAIENNGQLFETHSLSLDGAAAAYQIRLLDGDSRLLVSTETSLTEYALSGTTRELTSAIQTTTIPVSPRLFEEVDPPEPGPVDIVVTSDGRFVYTILEQNQGTRGGYINAWSRDPASGALQLVDQLIPTDFINNPLWRPYPAVLTADETILLLPSFAGRFFAGSPSVTSCVNAFSRDEQSGVLQAIANDCSLSNGRGLAQQPDSNRYYSIYHGLRPFSQSPPPSAAIGVFEPGRILQPTNLHAAVLPISRSLSNRGSETEEPLTYFSTVLNPGSVDAEQCTVSSDENNHQLRFQITDPATDEPVDPENFQSTFNVPANGAQTLLLTLYATNDFAPTNIDLEFKCLNAPLAPSLPGINSILMSASQQDLPDLITGVATIGNTGIVQLPSTEGLGVFAVSTINIGGEDEIEAIPVLDLSNLVGDLAPLGVTPDLNLRICETNPATGECLAAPSDSVVRSIGTDEIVTYTVSVVGAGSEVALDPAVNRAFVVLLDSAGEVRGASSVAVTTQ